MNWEQKSHADKQKIENLESELGVPKIISTLLVQRGIQDFNSAKNFFRPSLDKLNDPFLMKDMDIAINRINNAKLNNEIIMIYGDYDVDGVTSVTLLYLYLSDFFENIIPYMPDRNEEGYGVSFKGIDIAFKKGVTLIIALDCGIKAKKQVLYAEKKGIDFIICDHHIPSKEIPPAKAILNPKRHECGYPFKELCGCGIGFKLVQALSLNWDIDVNKIKKYLDLVAIATISDLVPLNGENRILCYYGIMELEKNKRLGLKSIIRLLKKPIRANDVSFKIAPRINSAGRMNHAIQAFRLLISNRIDLAEKQNNIIEEFNNERKKIDKKITEEAVSQIKKLNEENLFTSVVYDKDWNKGVLGIVASRLIETFYRPTVVLCSSGNYFIGSVRSIRDFDVHKILDMCQEHIIEYGGHKYAAGLKIEAAKYFDFKKSFENAVKDKISKHEKDPKIIYDFEIELDQITAKVVRIINQMRPFGPKNNVPIFKTSNCFDSGNSKIVGKNNEHLKLEISNNKKNMISGIAFGNSDKLNQIKSGNPFDILYSIEENKWNGKSSIQLKIEEIQIKKT